VERLRDRHSIKRVGVQRRQFVERRAMFRRDRQQTITGGHKELARRPENGGALRRLAKANLMAISQTLAADTLTLLRPSAISARARSPICAVR
jgi:hypothetical protein